MGAGASTGENAAIAQGATPQEIAKYKDDTVVFESEIVAAISTARTNPAAIAKELREMLPHFQRLEYQEP